MDRNSARWGYKSNFETELVLVGLSAMHFFSVAIWPLLAFALPWVVLGAPTVTSQSSVQLDSQGVFFVSYDGLVNVESFQQSGVVTYSGYQYAAWYTSTRYAILARRLLPSGSWSTLQLPHQLSVSDSHNVIAIGISPSDGRIHIAMDVRKYLIA